MPTLGPWIVARHKPGLIIDDRYKLFVANVCAVNDGAILPAEKENRDLICAAPKMYALLREMVDNCGAYNSALELDNSGVDGCLWVENVRKVLAAAEGKA